MPAYRPAAVRFWEKVDLSAGLFGCWLWTGAKDPRGYGNFRDEGGVYLAAHRWAYIEAVGRPDPGLELDHLCRVHNCVNPAHLEAVAHRVNVRRSPIASSMMVLGTCQKGHDVSIHGYYRKDRPGYANCRECRREIRTAKRDERRRTFDGDPRSSADFQLVGTS